MKTKPMNRLAITPLTGTIRAFWKGRESTMNKVMMSGCAALAALMAPAMAHAQAAAPAATVQLPPADPARVAVAQRIMLRLVPPGIYKQVMGSMFDNIFDLVPEFKDLPRAEVMKLGRLDDTQYDALDKAAVEEAMTIYDPHARERMQVMMKAMTARLGDLLGQYEPRLRTAMATAFAREFTLDELNEYDRFFAGPAGSHYAGKMYELFMGPDVMKEMSAMMPDMMKQMPDMMQDVMKAVETVPKARKLDEMTPAERARLAKLLGVDEGDLKDPEGP